MNTPRGLLLALALSACAADKTADGFEGDDAGECTDGADNDRDGNYDCDDQDCWGSPDCSGDGTDGGTGNTDGGTTDGGGTDGGGTDGGTDGGGTDGGSTDGGDTGDTGLPDIDGYSAVSVTYTLEWAFDLPIYGLEDCTQEFSGGGDWLESDGLRVTFDGDWTLVASSCAPTLDDAIWFPEDGTAYTTLYFSEDRSQVETWMVHEDADELTTDADPSFWISDMEATLDAGGDAAHTEDEYVASVLLTLTHSLTIDLE